MPKLAKVLSQVEKANEVRKARALEQGFNVDAFHGTTHDFSAFGGGNYEKGGHFGGSNYFTSSADDADRHYAGEGPDLTNRIQKRAEQIEAEVDLDPDEAIERARGELKGHGGAIIPIRLNKGKSYQLTDENDTFLTYERDTPNWEDYLDDADGDEDLARGMAIDDSYANEPEGELAELIESIRTQGYEHDFDPSEVINNLVMSAEDAEGLRASEIDEIVRGTEWYAEDYNTGELINTEVYRQAIQDAGFDSIQHKGDIFPGMEVEPGTVHTIVFDPANIRAAHAKFDPENLGREDMLGNAALAPLAGVGAASAAGLSAPVAYNQAQSMDRPDNFEQQRQASYAKQKQFFDNFSARRLARKAAKTAIGTGEAALTIGSGLANESAAGLAGLYGAATGQNPADIIQHFQENPSLYLPQTEEGMAQLEGLQGLIDDTAKYWGPRGGTQAIQNFKQSQDYLNTQGAKIDPSLGAGMATALGLLPEVL